MRFILVVFLLLTVPQVHAQEPSSSSAVVLSELNLTASNSASPSATNTASPSAVSESDQISSVSAQDQEPVLLDESSTQTALIYTGIMILILVAFIAGKKSSQLDKNES
jgi:hypothetical protein